MSSFFFGILGFFIEIAHRIGEISPISYKLLGCPGTSLLHFGMRQPRPGALPAYPTGSCPTGMGARYSQSAVALVL